MKFHVVSLIMILFTDASLSADPQFNLTAVNDNSGQELKTIAFKGFAKYKPGGSVLSLSLLIKGPPGMMPGTSGGPGGPGGAEGPGGAGGAGGAGGPGGAGGAGGAGSQPPTSSPGGSAGTQQPGAGPSASPTPAGGSGSTQSPTSGSGGGGSFQDFEKEALEMHNKFRKVHSSQPMKLNREMCDEAAAYAKIIAQSGSMRHSSREQRKGQGENLSMGCSSSKGGQTTKEAVENWYNEVCKPGYSFGGGRGQGGTGHFTQVVWNDSVELGIGKADSTQGRMKCTYIVGRYKPLGNFDTGNDDYKKNVKQGSFNQAYCNSIKRSFEKSSSSFSKVLKRK